MGAFAAFDQDVISRKLLAPPQIAVAKKKPEIVRFELVETPDSAKVDAAPKSARLMSDKNTRAQDLFQSEKKLPDAPHMEGKNPDARDTRPQMISPPETPRQAQKPAPPAKPAEPVRQPEKQPPAKEPAETKKDAKIGVSIEPEPLQQAKMEPDLDTAKKEVIQLAKKSADVSMPVAPAQSSRVVSAASPRNTNADAEITGELSYAASRHFFGEYLLAMKQAVERQWISRLVTKYTGLVVSKAVIDFKIQPDGRVTDMSVNSSEGDPYFPLVCVSSINDAQPFGPIPYSQAVGLPEEFMNKPLNIRFTFQYD